MAITGVGVVSPFGVGRERFWTAVTGGCSGVRTITEFDAAPLASRVAAMVPPVSIEDAQSEHASGRDALESRADPRRYSRASLIAVLASREAWQDAGLRTGEPDAGVIVGSGAGGIDVAERQYHN